MKVAAAIRNMAGESFSPFPAWREGEDTISFVQTSKPGEKMKREKWNVKGSFIPGISGLAKCALIAILCGAVLNLKKSLQKE